MSKRAMIYLKVIVVIMLGILLTQQKTDALGDDECICQPTECIIQMEAGCIWYGGEQVGWRMGYGVCYGTTCDTSYTIICQDDGRFFYLVLVCSCPNSSLCEDL